jgi:GntR family transcriptional regulator, transcriptional repressor for pyruvate dehydrogenase complex
MTKTKISNAAKSRNWTPVRARSVSAQIVNDICDALFSGEISSGEFLGSEADLAEQFGVSRFPVRDALRTLEALGVIEIRMGAEGGAFVANGNPEHFSRVMAIQLQLMGITTFEVFDSQMAVEGFAIEMAAINSTSEDHLKFDAILAEMKENLDNAEQFLKSSLGLHRAMVEASHNRALVAQWETLRDLLFREFLTFSEVVSRNVYNGHKKLIGLIRSGDGASAREHICNHIAEVKSHFKATENKKIRSMIKRGKSDG